MLEAQKEGSDSRREGERRQSTGTGHASSGGERSFLRVRWKPRAGQGQAGDGCNK